MAQELPVKLSRLLHPVISITSLLLLTAQSAHADTSSVDAVQPVAIQATSEIFHVKGFQQPSTNAQLLVQASDLDPLEPEEEITVTGTRTPRPVNNSAGTISVFDIKDLENNWVYRNHYAYVHHEHFEEPRSLKAPQMLQSFLNLVLGLHISGDRPKMF